jgi:hypothetical protein
MFKIKFNKEDYWIRNNWEDITLEQAIQLVRIEIPENLLSYYHSLFKKEDENLSLLDEAIEFPKYYKQVLEILTDLPIGDLSKYELYTIYRTYLESIIIGLHIAVIDYEYKKIDSFEYKKEKYYLPKDANILGHEIPMNEESIGAFTDCSTLLIAADGITLKRYEHISSVIAILCRKKGEVYGVERNDTVNFIDEDALKRANDFMDLPMDIVHEVFFCLIELQNTFSKHSEIFQDLTQKDVQMV